MSDERIQSADDGFERYYLEKLWEWVPEVHRTTDGGEEGGGTLRALLALLASQAAVARRSVDRLWEDAFIEFCDDWAVPYLADLVGTRLLSSLNRRGRRADVARTIFYRRRKGTLLVLETLIRDITGREGVVVESFRRLARTRHGLDAEPAPFTGVETRTPPGGWLNVRANTVAELLDGPFDEFGHTADVRHLRGKLGRYNIPKLNFHLYRLLAFGVTSSTPASFGAGCFTFDPSGRDVPAFSSNRRPGPEDWRPARRWEVPAPMTCRLLGGARYRVEPPLLDQLAALGVPAGAIDELAHYVGVTFKGEARLRETLASLPSGSTLLGVIDMILARAITPESPKANLYPPVTPQSDGDAANPAIAVSDHAVVIDGILQAGDPVPRQRMMTANLDEWGGSITIPAGKELLIDPVRGRFFFPAGDPPDVFVPIVHYGFSWTIGAGTYGRPRAGERTVDEDFADLVAEVVSSVPNGGPGIPGPDPVTIPSDGHHRFEDDRTYLPDGDVPNVEQLLLESANRRRPYLLRVAAPPTWKFTALAKALVPPGTEEPPSNLRLLRFDGLWIGIVDPASVPVANPVPTIVDLVLDGVFDHVAIRNGTIDPGGEKARDDAAPAVGETIPGVRILVRGTVKRLTIEASIVGPIGEDVAGAMHGRIEQLVIKDSIVHSALADETVPPTVPAIDTELGQVRLERVTVFGDVHANRLHASETIVQGRVAVTDNQHGCFRFSTAKSQGSQLPRQFQCWLPLDGIPDRAFVSRRFGHPGYAQLSAGAPPEVARGGVSSAEMGAFCGALLPIRVDDLRVKILEYMPFGRIPQLVEET